VNGRPATVLLDTYYGSLDVARSLGRRGIRVLALDVSGERIGARSRYLEFRGAPADERELLARLLELRSELGHSPVLLPLSDENLVFLERYQAELEGFLFHRTKVHSLSDLVSKSRGSTLLRNLGIDVPRAAVYDDGPDDEWESLRFPVVLKPQFHDAWLGNPAARERVGSRKVLLVQDREELARWVDELRRFDVLVAQEYVPGASDNLFYYVGYRDRSGETVGSFVGQKMRTLPDRFGTESILRSVRNAEVARLGETVLERSGHVGVAGVDCKLDERDRKLKVIEVNWRLGLSDGLAVDCGFDVPFAYYLDVQGLPVPKLDHYITGRYWCWLERDLEWLFEYGRERGVGIGSWLLEHLRRRHRYVTFAWDDPAPFLRELGRVVGRAARRGARSVG
jgi:predicted ATP-grasp superfamily ATP-dependent carboligase